MAFASESPLRNRSYRRLFGAQVASLVGTGLTSVALALLAHDLAGGDAGMVLGTVLALKMAIYVLVAPIIGALAVHAPRKALLVGLDILRALIVLALPFVDSLWQIYVLVGLLNIGAAGFTPTFQASIPDVLPDEGSYTRALSLARLAYDLENLLSPALAAIALSFVSYTDLFLFDSATFVISAALVATVTIPAAQTLREPGGLRSKLTLGLRRYLATPRLRGLLALHLAAAAAGAMVIVNTVVYVREGLGLGETEVAWAMAATGAGSMVVALVAPRLLRLVGERPLMLAGGAALALALVLAAIRQPPLGGLLGLWALIGIGSSAIQTPAGRLIRRSCHPSDRPAFFAAEFALSHAAWLVAYPVAGLVGAAFGMAAASATLATIAAVGTLAAALAWPSREPEEHTHTHASLNHSHAHVHDAHHQHEHEGWEGPEPHVHPHAHAELTHEHELVIDLHHPRWPTPG